MAASTNYLDKTQLAADPFSWLTGKTGSLTPASQTNATKQQLDAGGAPVVQQPPGGNGQQTPAEKLLQYATGGVGGPPATATTSPETLPPGPTGTLPPQQQPPPTDVESLAAKIFGPTPSGAGVPGWQPLSSGMSPNSFGGDPGEGPPVTQPPGDVTPPPVTTPPPPPVTTPPVTPPPGNVEPPTGPHIPPGKQLLPPGSVPMPPAGSTPPIPPEEFKGADRPPGTEDPIRAAAWYRTFLGNQGTSYRGVTAQDVVDYRTDPQGMAFKDWFDKNRRASIPPPPAGGDADPEVAAKWYAQFNGYSNVTADDVRAYRDWAQNHDPNDPDAKVYGQVMDFGLWYDWNRRGGGQNLYSWQDPRTNPGMTWGPGAQPEDPNITAIKATLAKTDAELLAANWSQAAINQFREQNKQYAAPPPATTPPPTTPPPPTAPPPTPPPAVTPPPATPPPPTAPPPPATTPPPPDPFAGGPGPAPNAPPLPTPDVSQDPWTQALQSMLGNYKDSADAQLRRQAANAASVTGELNMGGYVPGVTQKVADYNAGVDKEASTTLAAAHNSAMDRALQSQLAERAQQTQLELGRMDVMSKKYSADEQLEGEKYRAQIDQAIAQAQIDSQAKIQAAINEKDLNIARIQADSAALVASKQAQAAASAAGASAAAAKYAADLAYQGTIQKIALDREKNQMDMNLGLAGLATQKYGIDTQNQMNLLNFIKSLGPEEIAKYIFGNQPLPGNIFVQP